ncbi:MULTISPECIES: MarR family winged helix-turn-helix transcriptional regulator [Roseobacteraceae]|jgi:DNA-binding MarR family transcriptional regulator|uniref:Transcriptional regulator HosA n=1 Tax=Pseudosulfitobacter pseudonitzschiae TaxID=1402135 RepID=A0A221K067_9RHOB|nr:MULTISPECIES: MarR family transcriptional regulator [Roseobacteraceae]ASM72270.1 transcriptional regulator HosA [Pseudosulfitobacter pseudonitzschiae]
MFPLPETDTALIPQDLQDRVSFRIRQLQILAYKRFEKVITDFGSAPRYYGMLKIIAANPGIAQIRLAEAIFLDRSSLVPIIETLTHEGWLVRKPAAEDRRVRRVYLTDEGLRRLSLLEVEVNRHEARMTKGLSPQSMATLREGLEQMAVNLTEQDQTTKD